MDELDEFIEVLRGECSVLIKNETMMPGDEDAWRYYSSPLDEEAESDHLRAVLNAGKLTLEAKKCYLEGNENGTFACLARAQAALLRSISAIGKAESKKIGRSQGGKSRNESVREEVVLIADHLIETGAPWKGLASKVANELSLKKIVMREDKIKQILDENATALLNR
jgi:hypothetical protein